MRNIYEEEDYHNEVAASQWRDATIELGDEYTSSFPTGSFSPGEYSCTVASDHLLLIELDDESYAIIHRPSTSVLIHTWHLPCAEVMFFQLDRPNVDWTVRDLGSMEAESARYAIWLTKRVIKTGGYSIEYQIWPSDGDDQDPDLRRPLMPKSRR
jgi:hypothetical protein